MRRIVIEEYIIEALKVVGIKIEYIRHLNYDVI